MREKNARSTLRIKRAKVLRAFRVRQDAAHLHVQTSQEGFEPPTVRLEGACSIQLSYWDMEAETWNMIAYGFGKINMQSIENYGQISLLSVFLIH